jgi:hypothetical protein
MPSETWQLEKTEIFEDSGDLRITYNIPTTPEIWYRFDSNSDNWNKEYGTGYALEVSQDIPTESGVLYYVDVHIVQKIDGDVDTIVTQYLGPIRGRIIGITRELLVAHDYIGGGKYADWYRFFLVYNDGNYITYLSTKYPSEGETIEIVRVYRVDGLSMPPPGYKLKIYDCNGILLKTVDCPSQPQIQLKTPTFYQEKEKAITVKLSDDDFNFNAVQVFKRTINNHKSLRVGLYNTKSSFFMELLVFDSPLCTEWYPHVDFVFKKDKKKCPPNTCSVDCGTHRCCYDTAGRLIKQIEI